MLGPKQVRTLLWGRVTHAAWQSVSKQHLAPSFPFGLRSSKFAAVTDRVVYLFDDNGERKDKFKCVCRAGGRWMECMAMAHWHHQLACCHA